MDARCAPGWVLGRHPKDQIANFLRKPSSTNLADVGNGTPIEREPQSVPTHDGLRAHDHESLFPSGPKPPQQNPEELIECGQPWSRMSSLQCRELLAKSHIFKKHLVTSVEDSKDRTYKGPNGVDHATVLSHLAGAWLPCILLKSQAHRILANDSSRLGRSSVAERGNRRARAIPTTGSQSYPRQVQSGEYTGDARLSGREWKA